MSYHHKIKFVLLGAYFCMLQGHELPPENQNVTCDYVANLKTLSSVTLFCDGDLAGDWTCEKQRLGAKMNVSGVEKDMWVCMKPDLIETTNGAHCYEVEDVFTYNYRFSACDRDRGDGWNCFLNSINMKKRFTGEPIIFQSCVKPITTQPDPAMVKKSTLVNLD